MNKPRHVSELHVYEIGGIGTSQRRDFPIICGKTQVSKIAGSAVRSQKSEVSRQHSEVASGNSGATFLPLNKERFRFFDHAAQHSANRCTFSGQGMMLFRRDISA